MIELVNLSHLSLYKRLQVEEALLRTERRNFCLYSSGAEPAIVMGISQKEEEVIHSHANLPLIRRFSGGGTVVVGPGTDFLTFIISEARFPKEILAWCLTWIQKAIPQAILMENDYVIGDKKFAGNAQSIIKGRFLQHTSILWDFTPEEMALLKTPPKMPLYRNQREHLDFLTKLSSHLPKREALFSTLKNHFPEIQIEVEELLNLPFRQATRRLTPIQPSSSQIS